MVLDAHMGGSERQKFEEVNETLALPLLAIGQLENPLDNHVAGADGESLEERLSAEGSKLLFIIIQ